MLLTVAGFQVPLIPLVEVVDNVGAAVPEQKAGIELNSGVMAWLTVIVKVVVVAH